MGPDELRDRLSRPDWRAVSAARMERAEAIVAAWDAYHAADAAAVKAAGWDMSDDDEPLWDRPWDLQAAIPEPRRRRWRA